MATVGDNSAAAAEVQPLVNPDKLDKTPVRIRLEVVAIVIVLIVWGIILVASSPSSTGLKGGDQQNFLDWLTSSGGQLVLGILGAASVIVLLYSVYSILNKRTGGTSDRELDKTEWATTRYRRIVAENRARDEVSPRPKKRE